MAGFPSTLAVIRVSLFGGTAVATLPMPAREAIDYADLVVHEVQRNGFTAALVVFEITDGLDCWVRARDVQLVEVLPDEDPSS